MISWVTERFAEAAKHYMVVYKSWLQARAKVGELARSLVSYRLLKKSASSAALAMASCYAKCAPRSS